MTANRVWRDTPPPPQPGDGTTVPFETFAALLARVLRRGRPS